MKNNLSPIYLVLATMAVAAMAIGAEPVRENSKLALSKSEVRKPASEFVFEFTDRRLPNRRILVIDTVGLEADVQSKVAVAIATARARKRTS